LVLGLLPRSILMRLSRSCGYAWLLVLLSGHVEGCAPSPPVTSPPPQGGEPKKTEPATAPKNSENEGATSKESHDSGSPVVNRGVTGPLWEFLSLILLEWEELCPMEV